MKQQDRKDVRIQIREAYALTEESAIVDNVNVMQNTQENVAKSTKSHFADFKMERLVLVCNLLLYIYFGQKISNTSQFDSQQTYST